MSDETLDLIARRSDLLMKKDEASKAQRRARDEATIARSELLDAEDALNKIEKEEVRVLRQQDKALKQ